MESKAKESFVMRSRVIQQWLTAPCLPKAFVRVVGQPGSGCHIFLNELKQELKRYFPAALTFAWDYNGYPVSKLLSELHDFRTCRPSLQSSPCIVMIHNLSAEDNAAVMPKLLDMYLNSRQPIFLVVASQYFHDLALEASLVDLLVVPTRIQYLEESQERLFEAYGRKRCDSQRAMVERLTAKLEKRVFCDGTWQSSPCGSSEMTLAAWELREDDVALINLKGSPAKTVTVKGAANKEDAIAQLEQALMALKGAYA
jgi:hypothetical protein